MTDARAPDLRLGLGRGLGTSRSQVREALIGILNISDWAIGYILFTVGPLLTSLYYCFNQYTLLRAPVWIGLENYRYALFQESLFRKSVERTLLWTVTTVPLGIVGSFFAALLLDRGGNPVGVAAAT